MLRNRKQADLSGLPGFLGLPLSTILGILHIVALASWYVLLFASSLPRFHLLLQFCLDLTFLLQSLQPRAVYSQYHQPYIHYSQEENLIGPNSKVKSLLSLKEFKQRQVGHQSMW